MTADVRKPAEAERVVAKAVERFGRLDVLVNNAGGSPHALAADASPRFVEAIVNLNLLAPLWCAQSAHKVMAVQEDGGSIVNMSSVSGLRPSPGASAYGAAKAGLINLTSDARRRVGPARAGQLRERRAARHRRRRRVLRRPRRPRAGGGHRAARADGHARGRGPGLPVPGQPRRLLRLGRQPGAPRRRGAAGVPARRRARREPSGRSGRPEHPCAISPIRGTRGVSC